MVADWGENACEPDDDTYDSELPPLPVILLFNFSKSNIFSFILANFSSSIRPIDSSIVVEAGAIFKERLRSEKSYLVQ